ncbi:uncharacterized protein LY89DRAFT_747811 [Mollisia scopiformis]|uniref:Uncharacterized protein n=1 Tax=Mollisia scopiformis TaxID=149040 RepID=A0A194X931_MOLSC|nr:uncharacterized protein LY89DRAFT_747811 [Mollisia scopiformis]KUJ16680.1 hypothetical protein LY89DRAFT_747811 [Mollisia scopiformis]
MDEGQKDASTTSLGRGKGTSSLGNLTFVGLRSADFFLQLYLLRQYPLITSGSSFLGLTPYYAIVASLALITSVRHDFWKLYTSDQKASVSFAITVSAFNTIFNSLNIATSLWSITSNAPAIEQGMFASSSRSLGLGLFILGSFCETFTELQRKAFKDNPNDK